MINGYSGCKIEVKGKVLIKSTNGNYSPQRLKKQQEKQQLFKNSVKLPGIIIPNVYFARWKSTEEFMFGMEYFPVDNIIEWLERSTKEELDLFYGKLVRYFIYLDIKSRFFKVEPVAIEWKYGEVEQKLKNSGLYTFKDKFFSLLSPLEIPFGLCHGDMTTSNILFKSDDIILIDFLDTYTESILQDMVKIRQDTKYMWTLKIYDKEVLDKTKVEFAYDYLDKKIHSFFQRFPYYNKYYRLFQFMNLIRILPYVQDKEIIKYLQECIWEL